MGKKPKETTANIVKKLESRIRRLEKRIQELERKVDHVYEIDAPQINDGNDTRLNRHHP
jgi:hypothetical protein